MIASTPECCGTGSVKSELCLAKTSAFDSCIGLELLESEAQCYYGCVRLTSHTILPKPTTQTRAIITEHVRDRAIGNLLWDLCRHLHILEKHHTFRLELAIRYWRGRKVVMDRSRLLLVRTCSAHVS